MTGVIMLRKIVRIDEEKCNGCGACAEACHEGAIGMVNGKAVLLRDDYCDGMGDCLPECPTGAISFEVREAEAYNEAAAKENMRKRAVVSNDMPEPERKESLENSGLKLNNWPVQIKLAPLSASYFDGADLLIAADCTAFAYADFFRSFANGRVVLVGCPKLDAVDYSEKLSAIFTGNDIKSIKVIRMVVPCCGGLERAVEKAVAVSGKDIPVQVVTISIDGKII